MIQPVHVANSVEIQLRISIYILKIPTKLLHNLMTTQFKTMRLIQISFVYYKTLQDFIDCILSTILYNPRLDWQWNYVLGLPIRK